ncbi:hypothetical protein BAU15_00910 [Enterococcus sp. JM4C]|uniref:glucosaminidase domain-containing protein n=1 Tax=Candidatus Enterococcus huntleyi TaxID=1857217 RepID=UPI001379D62C|nr:glucosaminidase domain-containing protein [Enterococcus sp. JM4C]KAF1299237.1 hypothetical protein BAU15_00910 [Enterococcus sp. JM4C]
MDYKKVGLVSSVVLAYSGFSASISVEATTVSTDSFTLQDEQESKPLNLTVQQASQQSTSDTSSSTDEGTGSWVEGTESSTVDSSVLDSSGGISTSDTETTTSQTSESATTDSTTSTSTSSEKQAPPQRTTTSSSQEVKGKVDKTTNSKEQDAGVNKAKTSTSADKKEADKEKKKEVIPTVIAVSPNYSTQQFVQQIAEQARLLGQEHDLYASVMIAQAILESGSGNSGLASPPNYNLFGIKGSYGGKTVRFVTSEEDASGELHKVNANFRKYSSYKESLEDYANLLSRNLYRGARKSNTTSYMDATSFLTGRYATDTSYGAKLNGLIEAYNLSQYDYLVDEVPADAGRVQSKLTTKKTEETKHEDKELFDAYTHREQEYREHEVLPGESLKSISEQYQISIAELVELNQLNRFVLMVGQVLKIEPIVRPSQMDQEALIESDTRYKQDVLVNKKITEVVPEPVFKPLNLRYKITAISAVPAESYKVERGDSLLSISKKVGLSIQSIREWNQLESYILREGQVLRLTPTLDV